MTRRRKAREPNFRCNDKTYQMGRAITTRKSEKEGSKGRNSYGSRKGGNEPNKQKKKKKKKENLRKKFTTGQKTFFIRLMGKDIDQLQKTHFSCGPKKWKRKRIGKKKRGREVT